MTDLIPILGAVQRTRQRRVSTVPAGWPTDKYFGSEVDRNNRNLHIWIDQNTSGRFFLGHRIVAFEDEKEFILYKLAYKVIE